MNLTFFTSLPTFIKPIAKHYGEKEAVRVFVNGDQNTFMGALQITEIAWFDFANEMLLAAQDLYKFKTFKTIVRLHSYEAFTGMPQQVDWGKVDHLILVNESVRGILEMQGMWSDISRKTNVHIIPNIVDNSNFTLSNEKKKKIAYLGHINYKKDPSWIIPIAESLPDFEICVAGEHQDLRYKLMFDRYLPSNIKFEGFQKDVNSWLQDKMFVLNTSLFESFNYAIAEGMLCGAIPIVKNWLGVENVYPNIEVWNSLKECTGLIEKYSSASEEELAKIRKENRDFIVNTYDKSTLIPRIDKLIYENTDNG